MSVSGDIRFNMQRILPILSFSLVQTILHFVRVF